MKKRTAAILTAVIMAFGLSACGKKDEAKETEAVSVSTESTEAAADDSIRGKGAVVVNGFSLSPGVKYSDIKDKLGAEVKPASSAMPCDPNARGQVTTYYFDGFCVEVNVDDVVMSIYLPGEGAANDQVALACGLKVGSSREDAVNTFGLTGTDAELEYGGTAADGDFYVSFVWDGTISNISVTDMSIRP